ncbi:MAG: rhodanese-like domain-containing protein [Chloroflexota bacterium]|nr:rhodanese-like domain-containing protein [Chloroflexota bacterium]
MSQKPGQPQRPRKVSSSGRAQSGDDYQDYEEEEYAAPPQKRQAAPPQRAPQAQQGSRTTYTGTGRQATGSRGSGSSARPRAVQPKPDRFPYIIGALIGLAVAGLLGVAYLLGTGNKGVTPPTTVSIAPGTGAATDVAAAVPTTSGTSAPRMPIADFKALYDNPAKRPLIIDVRAKDNFDAGHILGATSFPEADVDARYKELPKDKLIVAYCQ